MDRLLIMLQYDRGNRRGFDRDPPIGRPPPPAYIGPPGDIYSNSKVNPMFGRNNRPEELEDFKLRDERRKKRMFGPQQYIRMQTFMIVVGVLSLFLLVALAVAAVALILTLQESPKTQGK